MSATRSMRLQAPAKLNLCLRVLDRRSDAYHEIQTAYQFVDLYDALELEAHAGGALDIEGDLATGDNLALRAAQALRSRLESTAGGLIRLRKRIPVGAGLGGGSSDAAAALVGFNRLWEGGLSTEELADIGRELGADVPLFVKARAAWGEGIGERLRPCEFPPARYLLIVPCVASTREVFAALNWHGGSQPMSLEDFLRHGAGNDCQSTAARLYPPIAEVLDWLRPHAPPRLTGTGAGVFAEFADPASIDKLLKLTPRRWRSFKLRGMNRSPLMKWLPDS